MKHFIDPNLLERLSIGPLAPYLGAYLARIEKDGFSPSSVPCQAYAIARFSRWLDQQKIQLKDIDESILRRFLDRDAGIMHRPEPETIRRLLLMLRENRVTSAEPPITFTPIQECVEEYKDYLLRQRGISERSLPNYLSYVEQFLSDRFDEGTPKCEEITAQDATEFVRVHTSRLSSGRAKLVVTALRSFFRYLLHQDRITVDLSRCVLPVALWSRSTLPKFLPPGTVQHLLRQQDRKTPIGRRNYAILLVLARLGLRAGEVVRLNLEDLDWEQGIVRICRKPGRWTVLPLPEDVGAVIAHYLHVDRPHCSSRRVFVRHNAPLRGFADTITVSSIVRRALIRAGIDSARTGAHLLRHTLAVDLLRNGASLNEIGDVLGHRSPNTTAVYAKVDLAALRTVALPWPGGAQ
jgi:site-specific recombinase XerD